MNRNNHSHRRALAGVACLLSLPLAAAAQFVPSGDMVWSGGNNNSFHSTSNYTPSTGNWATANLVFNTPTTPDLMLSLTRYTGNITINQGGSGFILNAASPDFFLSTKGGINVAENTTATFRPMIEAFNSTSASGGVPTNATDWVMNVGSGGVLNVGAFQNGFRPLVKKGLGTLTISSGSFLSTYYADGNSNPNVRLEEGTTILGNAAVIRRTNGSTGPLLQATLGSATTSATLGGGGTMTTHLKTYGVERSHFNPSLGEDSDGTLTVASIDATDGASFTMVLGDSLVTGTDFTGGELLFHFAGGEAGIIYTLLDFDSLIVSSENLSIATAGYILDSAYGEDGWLIQDGVLSVRFDAVPVPEPLAAVGMGIAGAALVLLRRRRLAKGRTR